MYLFLVIPLAQGLPMPYLSYFSREDISLGSLVFITIKKRRIPGIVVSRENLEDERMAVKNANFTIKKIEASERRDFISPALMETLTRFGEAHLHSFPDLFSHLIPERLISKKEGARLYAEKRERRTDILLISLPYGERIARYKSIIRESFARSESIVIYFPTIAELARAEKELSKGIEDYAVSFSSALTQKEYARGDEKLSLAHPLLILSTPSLQAFERKDLGYMIIEDEASHHYKSKSGIDFRELVTHLSKNLSLPLLYGSTLLTLSRFQMRKEGTGTELTPFYLRGADTITMIAMNEERRSGTPHLSLETIKELERIKEEQTGHYFIYTQRKGMYPSTVCADCSTLLTCKECTKPLVLHTIGNKKAYMCHYCEDFISISEENPIACAHCGGWRMRLLGIASSGIEALLSKTGIPLFVIDGERTRTKKEVDKVYAAWKKEQFGILIGTELALGVLEECDGSTIASIDSLFSLPEYGIDEKILMLLMTLKEKTKGHVFLQTRMSNSPLFTHLFDYSFLKYYEWALKEREDLHLPPFYSIIKASFQGLGEKRKESITETLTEKKREHVWFESGAQKLLLFIHIKKDDWLISKEIRDDLASLLSGAKLDYNPDTFFS